jgi:Leucine-rich repeat (LRR) protein
VILLTSFCFVLINSLNVSGNQLKKLPNTIGSLTELQQLDVKHNEISYLPPEIGQLKKCTKMDLSHNMVITFSLLILPHSNDL